MKLTKTKKVETITEEVTVEIGIYYFARRYKREDPYDFYRVQIFNSDAEYVNIEIQRVRDISDDYLISYSKDYTDYLSPAIESFFKKEEFFTNDEELTDIKEEEFFAVKEKVKQKL